MGNSVPRRRDDPPEVDMVGVRADERDFWGRAGKFVDHYKLAWAFWLIFSGVIGWVGVNLVQPLKAVPTLQAQNVNILKRLDSADSSRADMNQVLKVFGKILCADMSAQDRYKYDINCRELPQPDVKTPRGI